MSAHVPAPATDTARDPRRAVARLSARGLPGLPDVRTTALRAEPGAVVLEHAGAVRRLEVGGSGVTEAVHVAGPELVKVAPDTVGAVDLQGAQGLLLRLDLRDWLPEHGEVVGAEEALRRSGVREVLEQAGLALRPVRRHELVDAVGRDPGPSRVPAPPRLPLAFTVVRSLAVVVAVGCLLTTFALQDDAAVALVVGALALLVSAVHAVALRVGPALRARVGAPAPLAELRPRPGGPTTARFRRTARLQRHPRDVVVVDDLGRERWLPVDGPLGVTTLAVVRSGTPAAQVEVRAGDGTPRATLREQDWCAGPDGEQALRSFAEQAGLALETAAAPARRRADEEERARAAFGVHPLAEVRRVLDHADGLPGQAASVQTPLFTLLLLLGAVSLDGAEAALPVLAAVLVLTVGVTAVRGLLRRAWLDRLSTP